MEHYFTDNPNTKSEIRTLNYIKEETSFNFFSDNGVFAKDKIDYGSILLLETFLKYNEDDINKGLDVGCGYGFLGIVLSKLKNIEFDLIDINKRAIHLCERNIKQNKVNCKTFISNIYVCIEDKYDLIITNPPIRAGKPVVMEMLMSAKEHLNDSGSLWFVMRKDHGVKSTIKKMENAYKLEILAKSKGFYVVKAKTR